MNEATLVQTIMTLLILAIFIGFIIWGIKSQQFHNIEDTKYHIFHNHTDINEEENNHQEGKQ